MRYKNLFTALLVLGGSIAAAVLALSFVGGAAAKTAVSDVPAAHSQVALFSSHSTARILRMRFSLLRTPRVAADQALPADWATWLDHAGPIFGLNTSDASSAQPAAGVTMWLVPGESGGCIIVDIAASNTEVGSCGPLESSRLGFSVGALTSAGRAVYGFVPDGNSTVTATLTNGQTIKGSVTDNAYVVEASAGSKFQSISGIGLRGRPAISSF
jgi:hypothetical protein